MLRWLATAIVLAMAVPGAPAMAQKGAPKAALVLIPGAGGASPNDFLVRSLETFRVAGLEVEMTTSASRAASAIEELRARGLRVTLVGMSLGAVTAAQAIAGGARPDRVVFAAGGLLPPGTPNGSVIETLGNPAILPRTMILHNRQDACRFTSPEAVAPFVRWSRGRARAQWVNDPVGEGYPCRARSPHAFAGPSQHAAAEVIVRFAKGR